MDDQELRSAADDLKRYTTESDRFDIADLLEKAAEEIKEAKAKIDYAAGMLIGMAYNDKRSPEELKKMCRFLSNYLCPLDEDPSHRTDNYQGDNRYDK